MEGDGHAGGNRRRHRDISIHSLRMEGDKAALIYFVYSTGISIHSLRMEGDYRRCGDCNAYLGFQSTPSAWRETYVSSDAFAASHISIHSLRMEGDRPHPRWTQFRSHFNPLPPHGGRRISSYHSGILRAFQSTPSAWRETSLFSKHFTNVHISIHSLRMEGDTIPENDLASVVISIHSLRMEGDCG